MPETRIFRRRFDLQGRPRRASLAIFAESVFHVWINGQYVGRGPAFHHAHRRMASTFNIAPHLRAGANVIAALVYSSDVAQHNNVPIGSPGLIARLVAETENRECVVETDAQWKASTRTGWIHQTPRRGWALSYIESFDPQLAEPGWRGLECNDRDWANAEIQKAPDGVSIEWLDDQLPPLKYNWQSAAEPMGVYSAPASLHMLNAANPPDAYAAHMMNQPWATDSAVNLSGSVDDPAGLNLTGLTADRATMICFDLGENYTGQFCFDAECETGGTIEIGWSEVLHDGRPEVLRKRTSYLDRFRAVPGENRWQPIAFSAGRYFCLIFQGFSGSIRISQAGILASEPELNWAADFSCDDPHLNAIWGLCTRTLRIGTQEGIMDCPTREQAPYVGDGHPTARWIGMLTGDWRHWKYIVQEQFVRQSPDGLIRDSIFTGGRRSLVDYNLLAVIGTRDYLYCTGDLTSIRETLPACRRIFQWFDDRRNRDGLIDTDWEHMSPEPEWEHRYDPAGDAKPWATNVFIDHPGLGWHNLDEPGIDRRGINTAINAIYVIAKRALAELEDAAGNPAAGQQCRRDADLLASRLCVFFDLKQNVFADGLNNGTLLTQISQQANIWTVEARQFEADTATAIVDQILCDDDPRIARAGPYFWVYLFPLLTRLNLHERALQLTREYWGRMLGGGASTLWETFSGDGLDTWCHPWAAAPIDLLLCDILGLGKPAAIKLRELKPRYDLLKEASGRMQTASGEIAISWQVRGDSVLLSGTLPDGIRASLLAPTGECLGEVSGDWQLTPRNRPAREWRRHPSHREDETPIPRRSAESGV